jgi:hypothetical protein
MKRLSLALGALALAVLCAQSSKADTFNFSFTGTSFSGSGTIDATEIGNTDEYHITNIFGTTDGQSITGLLNPGTFDNNDNILFFPAILGLNFDQQGVSFQLGSGSNISQVNIAEGNGIFFLSEIADLNAPGKRDDKQELVSFDVTKGSSNSPVPEPGTLALLGTGILGAAGAIRRRLMA